MARNVDDFAGSLGAIAAAQDVPSLRDATVGALAALGCTSAYFVTPPIADSEAGRIIATLGLSPVLERHYRAGLHRLDPLPEIALARVGAFVWPDGLGGEAMTRRQRRYLDIVASHGLRRGVATMCYGPAGRCGFLAVVLSPEDRNLATAVLAQIDAIGQMAFQRYCRLVPIAQDRPRLSKRELDVLRLISRGKSNGVIAEVLAIAPTSVDAYVRRIFAKMGVTDRTTAAVMAQALGLVATWDHDRLMKEAQAHLANY